MADRRRWFPADPRSVGQDPDYRFSFANERTFLAWIRTSLALSVGALGVVTLLDELRGTVALALGLLAVSFATTAMAYRRWALNERAMRLSQPLPPSRLPQIVALGVALVAIAVAVLLVIDAA